MRGFVPAGAGVSGLPAAGEGLEMAHVLKCTKRCSTVIAVHVLSTNKADWPKCWYRVSHSEEEFPRFQIHEMELVGDSWALGDGVFRWTDSLPPKDPDASP